MKIFLLTHQRELKKKSNTGKLVLEVLGHNAEVIIWERLYPNDQLIELIKNTHTALMFQTPYSCAEIDIERVENFVVIDSTWQEARKIYNKSPYLKETFQLDLKIKRKSIYTLRRNQKTNGLCTAECAIEILRLKGKFSEASELESCLIEFVENKLN